VIKFRCQRCSQKIAMEDDGAGLTLACPTCAEIMIAPAQTDREFLGEYSHAVTLEIVPPPAPVPRPSWSQLILEKLVPALLSQRRDLMRTQDDAAEQLAALEQRVMLLKAKFQRRVGYYQDQVAELEAENRELAQLITTLRRANQPTTRTFNQNRVNLRDAGFLLRM
jgi:DNA-directed RNA polymerase subunit RPC12/RpoP